ncbi:hypothetical protein [Arthrobacter cryoconiti]|uniref:2-isopropylmalate synthase n=1 Tax=Arthrobacter cryoconiti TaxID=748907 RepID=A0ABV8QWJ8_9MICC|nr:hypothetical protein [Arthrobacter cryoconiti]MCC9068789.1 hypothetical protein [Arthrobacter cryoconiti]
MAQIQLIISNDNGTSSTGCGSTTDQSVITAAMVVMDALTAAAINSSGVKA